MMSHKEIKEAKKRLLKIMRMEASKAQSDALHQLAMDVGASTFRLEEQGRVSGKFGDLSRQNVITETEIVHNINEALESSVVILMGRAATRSYWITLLAMLIALGSALAAWYGVLLIK